MIQKIDIGRQHHEVFGNPAPMGLLGLAIACAALVPMAMGMIGEGTFLTAGIFAILFGAGCQLITGLMDFANRNAYGGTIFTTFAFNWLVTGYTCLALAFHWPIDHNVVFATEIVLFVVFVVLTYGFGFFSSLLFAFLFDIDLLYACKIFRAITQSAIFNGPIALFTIVLGLLGLWLALAGLINPVAGKPVFAISGPMFFAPRKKGFDWSIRREIFEILYNQWRSSAFEEMTIEELSKTIKETLNAGNILPEIHYLAEYGCLKITTGPDNQINSLRLNAKGIDLYEQLILRKYEF